MKEGLSSLTAISIALGAGLTLGSACRARAAEHRIEMFQSSFLPPALTIDVGDTVTWTWIAGSHTVTSGLQDAEPGSPDEPGKLFDVELNAANPTFSRRFDEPREGGHPFFCRAHPGQVGFIQLSKGDISVRVAVVDNVFNPEEVFIFEGDSVKWEHEFMEDFHTVTSGLSSRPEDQPGALFDEESSDQNPIFVYTFETAGEYPYFCVPHEAMGMKGRIRVQERFVRGDTSGEGQVDISDAVAILNFLFVGGTIRCCEDATDSNDDGKVDIGDPVFILNFLFAGTTEMPPPFPRPGADRTEDPLYCWD